jgi:hypothetical protein
LKSQAAANVAKRSENPKMKIFAAEKFLARRVLEFWNLEFAAARSVALLLPATQRPFYCIHILSIRILAGFSLQEKLKSQAAAKRSLLRSENPKRKSSRPKTFWLAEF